MALSEHLQIQLITFNRAAALEHTLGCLHASPFAGCAVRILDNCSDDDTPAVCARWRKRFADLEVIRHRRNIGGNANLLRAAELSEGTYTWILADDDYYDFEDCDDVLRELQAGEVDLICVGGAREGWEPGRSSVQALSAAGRRFWWTVAFLPSMIFRTELFDSRALSEGYRLADDLFPHFAFYRRQAERDASVHVSRRVLVLRAGDPGVPSSPLYWLRGWARSCGVIASPQQRRQAIYEIAQTPAAWWRLVVATVAIERLYHPERVWRLVLELSAALVGRQRAALPLAVVTALAPLPVLRRVAGYALRSRGGAPELSPFPSLEERP